jgi:hypothetical protein
MRNVEAESVIETASKNIENAKLIMDNLKIDDILRSFLTHFAIVKASASIEVAFKTIIADACVKGANQQAKNLIDNKIRESSCNPSYDNICRVLKEVDEEWCDNFKERIKAIPDRDKNIVSLKSLVDARNHVAHGKTTTVTINSIVEYFSSSLIIIRILDEVVE